MHAFIINFSNCDVVGGIVSFSNCISTVNVNVIMHLPASYQLTCVDKFMYMQVCLASSIIIMHACFARNYPKALSHCGHGHDLTSVAQLSVVNIADIRSAFVETLASECFRRYAIDGAP